MECDVGELEPDPVIEHYEKDIDRTLLRENLRLTVEERLRRLQDALRLVEELRRGVKQAGRDERPPADP